MTSDWRHAYDRKHAGHRVVLRRDDSRFCLTCAEARAAERRHNVKVLTLQNQSALEISIRLGVSTRTVVRDRARLRAAAPARPVAA